MARIAFMFPGQGSQKVGMGRDFAERYPELLDQVPLGRGRTAGLGVDDERAHVFPHQQVLASPLCRRIRVLGHNRSPRSPRPR